MSVRTNTGFLDSVPIGAGMEWFTDTPPENWMLQNGAAISRTDYAELFAIIGTTYGVGNGSTTFNLPDKRGRVGVGKSASGTFANLGTKTGAETVTLTKQNIPTLDGATALTSIQNQLFGDFDFSDSPQPFTRKAIMGITFNSAVIKYTNLNLTAVNKVQPSLVQNYIIKVK